MRCEQCEPQLNALADGELSPLTAWRLRRHLRHCAACTEAYAQIQWIGDRAHDWRDATAVPAPVTLRSRLQETTNSTQQDSRRKDRKMIPVMPALAVAATVLVAAFIGISAPFNSHPNPVPGVAFAQVQEAVGNVRTARVVFKIDPNAASHGGETITAYEAWLQVEPAAFAVITPATRMVGDNKGVLLYMGDQPPMRISNRPITRSDIQKQILFPELKGSTSSLPQDWGTGTTVQDSTGRTLLRFIVKEGPTQSTLWADPRTQLPVRVEIETRIQPTPETSPVITRSSIQFSFNELPPAGIFQASVGKKDRAG